MNIQDLTPGLVVQDGRKVLQVSNVYDRHATLSVIYPAPPRTLVLAYQDHDVELFLKPVTDKAYAKAFAKGE